MIRSVSPRSGAAVLVVIVGTKQVIKAKRTETVLTGRKT